MAVIFRQLFDRSTSTFTYLVGCSDTREAVLIDPVVDNVERDLDAIATLGLTLRHTLETHVHADHITGAARLRALSGCKTACPAGAEIDGADVLVSEIEALKCGALTLKPLHTPGHTDNHHCYVAASADGDRLFSGDCLLIDGCGRTDFQGGNAEALYRSVHDKLFTLAPETLVYPSHDYQGRRVSSIGQEQARNPRLGGGKTVDEFVAIMAALNLPAPKMIAIAVPANLRLGDGA